MTAFKEKAYAKINLHLDVVKKRDDGFHEIKTVMHTVSLYDSITVSTAPSRELNIKLTISGVNYLPADSKNLAYKAANLFFERLGMTAEVNIRLEKRIPISAGLAGGSSDAAAVLRALNRLYKRPFTIKALMSMGAELGSDVPYCVVGKTALCEGRGEKLTRLNTTAKLNFVVASAGERVSTPMAYGDLDKKYNDFIDYDSQKGDKALEEILSVLKNSKALDCELYNIFESAVFEKCPKSKKLKEDILALGATVAVMSGSGPSVYGIFETESTAKSAKESLINSGYTAYYAKSV